MKKGAKESFQSQTPFSAQCECWIVGCGYRNCWYIILLSLACTLTPQCCLVTSMPQLWCHTCVHGYACCAPCSWRCPVSCSACLAGTSGRYECLIPGDKDEEKHAAQIVTEFCGCECVCYCYVWLQPWFGWTVYRQHPNFFVNECTFL